jgi:hypothetical protein
MHAKDVAWGKLSQKRQEMDAFHTGRLRDAGMLPIRHAVPEPHEAPEAACVAAYDAPIPAVQAIVGRPVAHIAGFDSLGEEGYHSAMDGGAIAFDMYSDDSEPRPPRKHRVPTGASASVAPPGGAPPIIDSAVATGRNLLEVGRNAAHGVASATSLLASATSLGANGLAAGAAALGTTADVIDGMSGVIGLGGGRRRSGRRSGRARGSGDQPSDDSDDSPIPLEDLSSSHSEDPLAIEDRARRLAIQDRARHPAVEDGSMGSSTEAEQSYFLAQFPIATAFGGRQPAMPGQRRTRETDAQRTTRNARAYAARGPNGQRIEDMSRTRGGRR